MLSESKIGRILLRKKTRLPKQGWLHCFQWVGKNMFMHQHENPWKPPTKVKRTKEEIQTTLENRKKATTEYPRSVFKRKS
jgi:hypothetical protein